MRVGADPAVPDELSAWIRIADMSLYVGAHATVTAAELEACFAAVVYLYGLFIWHTLIETSTGTRLFDISQNVYLLCAHSLFAHS